MNVFPILLAGGSGTRLWPLSRKSFPKQFVSLDGEISLFQEAILRLSDSNIMKLSPHITFTSKDFRFIVGDQFRSLKVIPGDIFIEPEPKNTGPAILAASMHCYEVDKESILLVAPADHLIPDKKRFHLALEKALAQVEKGKIVTFGVTPTRNEIGFGYMELSSANNSSPSAVKSFVEKPSLERVKNMVDSGRFLWNSGIFMFKAHDMIEAFEMYFPELLQPVKGALQNAKLDLDFCRLDEVFWSACSDISIDYAIMEKCENLVTVPLNCEWTDLGGWNSVWAEMQPDEKGIATSSNTLAIDCKNSLLRSEDSNLQLVGLGLENIVAVAMPDAVLVVNKERTQEVKLVVSELKKNNIFQSENAQKDYRPWGWFERLASGPTFQVKRLLVNPGASLSLQSHLHRAEHWVVVEGTAKVTIGSLKKVLNVGQSVYIPLKARHRLENSGKIPLVIIEVQTGNYFGEDDIVRYEDIYSRE